MAGGRIEPGAPADFITVDLDSPRLAGGTDEDLVARLVYAATSADVTDVVVAGRPVVTDRNHATVPDVPAALASAIGRLLP